MSWFGSLEDAGGSWLGFGILILISIWSMVFCTPIFWILALYLDSEGAKNIHVLKVLIWGLRGCWRIMTGVWHLDLDSDMVTGLWYTHVSNFGSLSWLLRSKEHLYTLSPDLGLWRMLEVLYWGLASGCWFWYGHWSLVHPYSDLWLSILILKVQSTSLSFKSSFGGEDDAWES